MTLRLRRHDLAYLRPGAMRDLQFAAPLSNEAERWLGDWLDAGRPLVVCRQRHHTNADRSVDPRADLGAALPARLGRAKLACRAPLAQITRVEPPLSIDRLRDVLGEKERSALSRLAGVAQRLGVALGAYGSCSWEWLAGETHRSDHSDVDLICDVGHRDTLPYWLGAMESSALDMNDRLDGDVRFPGGQAVAWRELLRALRSDATARVMFKSDREFGFATVGSLAASLS